MFKLITISLLLVVVLLCFVKYLEKASLFFPSKEMISLPEDTNFNYKEIYFKTKDLVELNAWFFPLDKSSFTLIYCHGNAGNISGRLEKIKIFLSLGLSVFAFDYRGYGKSKGSPSENGLYLDTQSAYDYLVNNLNVKKESIIVYGESIGAAAAIDLASKNKIAALITEGAFTNIKDMAKIFYPYLPDLIFSIKFDSIGKIPKVKATKLFIHSREDEVIPFNLSKRLFEAAYEPKMFLEISGGHNDAFELDRVNYEKGIQGFVDGISFK